MKRFFIAVVFLAVMLGTCLFLVRQLYKSTAATKDEIAQISAALAVGDQAAADAAMQQLIRHWEAEKYLFHALAGSSYCDPFESALSRSQIWLGQRENKELLAELSELYSHIDQLWDTQAITPKNLF